MQHFLNLLVIVCLIAFSFHSKSNAEIVRCLGPCVCDSETLAVDCKGGGIKKVPFGIPIDTVILDLSNNEIEEIFQEDFSCLLKLETLYLKDNKILEVHNLAFQNTTNLKTLDLSSNSISFPTGFLKTPNLSIEELDLSRNLINTIGSSVLSGLGNLKFLNLSVNILSTSSFFPGSFNELYNLTTLVLSYNYLNQLPTLALNSRRNSIKTLDVSYNDRLGTLVQGQTSLELPVLEEISFMYCGLQTLDNRSLSGLPSLISLDLSYNRNLFQIDEGAFDDISGLTQLILSYTSLLSFPYAALTPVANSMKILEMESIKPMTGILPQVGMDTAYLSNLEYLSLTNNLVATVSKNSFFKNLETLKELHLSHTKLFEVPFDALINLTSLEILQYDGNQLTE